MTAAARTRARVFVVMPVNTCAPGEGYTGTLKVSSAVSRSHSRYAWTTVVSIRATSRRVVSNHDQAPIHSVVLCIHCRSRRGARADDDPCWAVCHVTAVLGSQLWWRIDQSRKASITDWRQLSPRISGALRGRRDAGQENVGPRFSTASHRLLAICDNVCYSYLAHRSLCWIICLFDGNLELPRLDGCRLALLVFH